MTDEKNTVDETPEPVSKMDRIKKAVIWALSVSVGIYALVFLVAFIVKGIIGIIS